MADDKHYVPGDYYQLDDISGFKVRASHTKQQWDSRVTAPKSFSPRQPQDLVTGVRDDQSVPVPRPRQANMFTFVGTQVIEPAARGASSITVSSTVGFDVGNACRVMLDQGEPFDFTLAAVDGNMLSWDISPAQGGLPGTVGTFYGDPIENQVLNLDSPQVTIEGGQIGTGGSGG